jgi:hypothetical protein
VHFNIELGSNAPDDSAGIGGSPASVVLKAGAGAEEPRPVVVDGFLRMNVDKGGQTQGGAYASVLGDVANGRLLDPSLSEQPYAAITRSGTHAFPVRADAAGTLWLLVGTDSGFEGLTRLYYLRITVTLTPLP